MTYRHTSAAPHRCANRKRTGHRKVSAMNHQWIRPWAPHPSAAPRTAREEGRLIAAGNGTRTCCGGWDVCTSGIVPGQAYALRTEVACAGVEHPRDSLECLAIWGEAPPSESLSSFVWDYLLPQNVSDGGITFARVLVAPPRAERLTIRCTFRWSTGRSEWQVPQVAPAKETPPVPGPVKVAVVTGHAHSRPRPVESIAQNVEYYARLCEAACREEPQLIVLPEIALQWQVPGHVLDLAVPAPGPETDAFAEIARRHRVRICLGMLERDGDAVFNTALLIGPAGEIDGRYHKVHLAVGGESTSGILAGNGFPVFHTEIGRIGCNICMDSSAAESSRMVGLNGADFLLLPIMGDHRADRWSPGHPIYNMERWTAIMRVRAMDNQLCMVVARNEAQGSCVIDRKGDVLAWNEGERDFITATVNQNDGYRMWNGSCFRDVNWLQRRPHLCGPFVDDGNVGSLR